MIRIIMVIGILAFLSFPARACEREIREAWHREEMAELRALINAPSKAPAPAPEPVSEPELTDESEGSVLMERIERNMRRIEALTRSAIRTKHISREDTK